MVLFLKRILSTMTIACSLVGCAKASDSIGTSGQVRPQVRFVTVDEGVQLEVLDWGGIGRPAVLLAGSGNTAHVFDEFAPKLAARWHTYAITRRGFGASTRPPSGYDDQRLANDVVSVLNALRIEGPMLIGHSMAGGELTSIASQHPNRVSGLVYLDAIADPGDATGNDADLMAIYNRLPMAAREGGQRPVTTSFAAYRASQASNAGWAFPESELRQLFRENADGSVGRYQGPTGAVHTAIGAGQKKRDYSRVTVPILALSTFACSPLNGGNDRCIQHPSDRPKYQPQNAAERVTIEHFESLEAVYIGRWKSNLRQAASKRVRLVDIPRASHHIFLSHEDDVLEEVLQFATAP
jgi:pimeloyl-ACP methyl ester carboxylesterase